MKNLFFVLAFLSLWGWGSIVSAAEKAPSKELIEAVEYLLEQTRASELVFIRNGKEYPPQEAVEHLQKKYDYFRKKRRVQTPEDFIRLAGTKSLISGKAYTVRLTDGTEQKAADWLTAQLKRFRAGQGEQ